MKLISDWMEHTDRHLRLMGRMAEKLEVDTAEVFGGAMGLRFRSMLVRCRACRQTEVCQRWLDGQEAGRDPAGFCPNAQTFADYRPGPPRGN